MSWYASRNEFVVRRVGGKSLADGPVSFRVKKIRSGLMQQAIEEQRRAAIEFWNQRSRASRSVGSDNGMLSPSSRRGDDDDDDGDDADREADHDGGDTQIDVE